MSETGNQMSGEPAGALGLADFLSELRAELAVAQKRAEGSSLRLGVDEVTVELDVVMTTSRSGEGSGKLSAKFWVLNAEVGGKAGGSSQRVSTQHLTLTLKPRRDQVTYDAQGRVQQVVSRGVDVAALVEEGEEFPPGPVPSAG
jgi:hypothetical protein